MAKEIAAKPVADQLTLEKMRQAIPRLKKRIAEVEQFEPDAVGEDASVTVAPLKASVDDSLVQTFGNETVEYQHYRGAANFSWPIGYGRHRTTVYDIRESLVRCKARSLALLRQAVAMLEERIEEQDGYAKADYLVDQPRAGELQGLHPEILTKCSALFEAGAYPEAVERSFKIVRDRLRKMTGHETGSEAFGKGGLYILGAAAPNVEADFNQGVKFLMMAIDMFRNEKSHTSEGNVDDPMHAYQYMMVGSLALRFLDRAEIRQ